jgi:hypothetical protein
VVAQQPTAPAGQAATTVPCMLVQSDVWLVTCFAVRFVADWQKLVPPGFREDADHALVGARLGGSTQTTDGERRDGKRDDPTLRECCFEVFSVFYTSLFKLGPGVFHGGGAI